MFTALLLKCSEKNVFALCRYIPRRNTPPRFVALVPQREELDQCQTQATPPGSVTAVKTVRYVHLHQGWAGFGPGGPLYCGV